MLKKLNENQIIVLAGNGILIISTILIFQIFITLYQSAIDFNNPILPRELFYEMNSEKIIGGIILSAGLIMMIMFKSIRQNLLILIIGILTILFYSFEINGLT